MSLVKSPLIALAGSDMQDFSIVMLMKTLGSLVGAPFMTILWVHAIKLGGIGLGLPYFISAVSLSPLIAAPELIFRRSAYMQLLQLLSLAYEYNSSVLNFGHSHFPAFDAITLTIIAQRVATYALTPNAPWISK